MARLVEEFSEKENLRGKKRNNQETEKENKGKQTRTIKRSTTGACRSPVQHSMSSQTSKSYFRWLVNFWGDLLCFTEGKVLLLTSLPTSKGTTVQSVHTVVLLPNIRKGPFLRKNEFTFKEHLLL